MNTVAAPTYVPCAGDVERDRSAVLAIRAAGANTDVNRERDAAKYDWFYRQCPFGPPSLQLLQHAPSATAVGMAAAGPRRMLWRGTEITAGVLVDLMATPEPRSIGPALMLQSALLESAGKRFPVLYGFPNPKAAPVFKRVGYTRWTDAVRYARVLRHAGYLRRRMPAPLAWLLGGALDIGWQLQNALRRWRAAPLDARWSDAVDPRMDSLWANSHHGDGLLGIRDSSFLRWRFEQAPRPVTRFLLLSDRDGTLTAWFACQNDDGLLHVRDAWSLEGSRGMIRAQVEALLIAAYRAGHSAVSFEFAGNPRGLHGWLSAGFQARAQRPLFGWCSEAVQLDADTDLYVTSGDEDEDA